MTVVVAVLHHTGILSISLFASKVRLGCSWNAEHISFIDALVLHDNLCDWTPQPLRVSAVNVLVGYDAQRNIKLREEALVR